MNDDIYERPLPSSDDAEVAILGGVLLENRGAIQVFAHLKPDDFFSPMRRRIAGSMRHLMKQGKPIDPVLIADDLKSNGHLDATGDIAGIVNLTRGLPHNLNLDEYIKIVKSKSTSRAILRLLNNAQRDILRDDDATEIVLGKAISELRQISDDTVDKTQPISAVVADIRDTFKAWEAGNTDVSSVKTGIPELDAKLRLNGLAYGELALVAARPSEGKTAALIQFATHAVRMGTPTLFISLEMLKERIVMRMLPSLTKVHNKAINPLTLKTKQTERERLYKALDTLEDLPMFFDRSFDISQLVATAEYYIQTKGVRLVAFDYLQLVKDMGITKNSTRDSEVGRITGELKELALRNNVALLGAAQLNRDSEKDKFRRPRKTDLRESGAIEQVADVLIFPWDAQAKDHITNPDAIKDGLWLDFYCDKQREGERHWTVKVYYDKNLQTMRSNEMIERDRPQRPAAHGGV